MRPGTVVQWCREARYSGTVVPWCPVPHPPMVYPPPCTRVPPHPCTMPGYPGRAQSTGCRAQDPFTRLLLDYTMYLRFRHFGAFLSAVTAVIGTPVSGVCRCGRWVCRCVQFAPEPVHYSGFLEINLFLRQTRVIEVSPASCPL